MLTALRWVAALAAAGLVFMMLGPFQGAEQSVGLTDKPAHVIGFGVITAAFFLVAPRASRIQVALTALSLGGLVEIIQGATGRSASVSDLAADIVGITLVSALWPHRPLVVPVPRQRP